MQTQSDAISRQIQQLFSQLLNQHGPQKWWPAETTFEMILGAYLVQHTSWLNAEFALSHLRECNALTIEGIRRLDRATLENLIHSSGFFRQKAIRIKAFVALLDAEFEGSLESMFEMPLIPLRKKLLTLPGVGRETADGILLYAGRRPVFVIDVYTRRLLQQQAIVANAVTADYEALRSTVERAFADYADAERTQVFQEFHALIVADGKLELRTRRIAPKAPLAAPERPSYSTID